jgi:DNA modification methylase
MSIFQVINADVLDGVVLDPFCGRGTTGMAAVRRGRKFIGIELDTDWAQLSEYNIGQAGRQLLLKGFE